MADNTFQSNNGHPPFRRYVPATNHDTPQPTQYTPPSVADSASASARPLPKHGPNSPSHWRQWVQPTPPKTEPSRDRPPVRQLQFPVLSNHAPSTTVAPSTPQPSSVSSPPAPAHRPSELVRGVPERPAPPPTTTPPGQPGDTVTSRRRPRREPHPVNAAERRPRRVTPTAKVTPLRRRQPPGAAVETPHSERTSSRPERPPRRTKRKPPQPVLHGIRLLILGTGIAAIVGTVLSSINANSTADNSAVTLNADSAESAARSGNQLSPAVAQPLPLAEELAAIKTDLVSFEAMTPGLDQTVFFYDLTTGNYIDIDGDKAVSAASTLKVPILAAFLQAVDAGTVQLDQAITLREDLIAQGSGDMDLDEVGTQYTALEVATEMIITSDNTATNLIIALLGGSETLNQQFQEWGLTSTRLRNLLPDLDGTNTTSSRDLVRIMALVDQGELLSLRSRDRFFGIMQRTFNRTLIPDGIADETALTYNKTGDIGTSLGDVALIDAMNGKRYIISVLVERPFNDGRASELIRRVSGRLYEEMSQPVSPLGSGRLPASDTDTDSSRSQDEPFPSDATSPEASEESETLPSQSSPNRQPPSDPEVPPG